MTATTTTTTIEEPQDQFKPLYKQQRRIGRDQVGADVLDCDAYEHYNGSYTIKRQPFSIKNADAMSDFVGTETPITAKHAYTVEELPGLTIIPGLYPTSVQKLLVEKTVEEYVPDERHVSNLNLHYEIPRPFDIFAADGTVVRHKESHPAKSTTIEKIRNKQLRWITLGGQYDWTNKVYPTFERNANGWPEFPSELANLVGGLFDIKAEAAIINFYSPGDTLSPHQDVAELSDADLVSLSIGCECIFYCGNSRFEKPLQLLLKSGDVVIMGKESRKAFHGVGRVFEGTGPAIGDDWKYSEWLKTKRVNINIRQMLE